MSDYRFAIEIFFDDKTDKHIRNIWEILKSKNITDSMICGGWHPHISLVVFDLDSIDTLIPVIKSFADNQNELPIAFTQIGVFPIEYGVVYFAPTVTNTLLKFHADFFSVFNTLTDEISDYYRPDKWIPHCSVGLNLSIPQIEKTVSICREIGLPQNAVISKIALVDLPTAKILKQFNLRINE